MEEKKAAGREEEEREEITFDERERRKRISAFSSIDYFFHEFRHHNRHVTVTTLNLVLILIYQLVQDKR